MPPPSSTAGASRRARRHRRLLAAVAAVTLPIACGDGSTDPVDLPGGALAGTYETLEFTVTEGGTTTNLRERGASLRLVLGADRTVSGRLLVPNGDEGGGDLDASMAGTWTVTGDVVRFQQTADTFVRDMPFTLTEVGLRGDASFGGARIVVALSRTP